MSYISLYRKFRPDTFREVKGQDHIVTTLQNQLKYDRVGHAYLFCGTRGTGKTTVAKILARAVNCEHPVEGNPCGECESCKRLQSGAAMNVIEIDAASNNGVDNIRDINAAVQYPPAEGKYIVYIIDEVHMLSTGAFNALLKTLEEPPSYVIFILATTEDMKVPVTIKSRCQRYDFHRISVETISCRLAELMERENNPAEPEALRYIAQAADGSMRDALSILEECVSASLGEKLTFDRVLAQVGAVDVDVYLRLLDALINEKAEVMLDIVNDAVWKGRDLSKFVDDMVWFVRNVLFLKMSPDAGRSLDLTGETEEKLIAAGKTVSEDVLVRYFRILQELSVSIRMSTIRRITLEMGLIRMMKPESDKDYESVISRLERLEAGGGIDVSGGIDAGVIGKGAPGGSDAAEGNTAEASGASESVANGSAANNGNGSAGNAAGAKDLTAADIRIIVKETVEKELEKYLEPDDSGTQKKRLKRRTATEEEALVRKNLKENYPVATQEEIQHLADEWNNMVVPKLEKMEQNALQHSRVDVDFTDPDNPGLKIIVMLYGEKDDNGKTAWAYLDVPERQERIKGIVSEIMKRKPRITFEKRDVGRTGDPDSKVMDLQRLIGVPVEVVD